MGEITLSTNLGNFKLKEHMLRYSSFIPRFYNLCKKLGLTPGKIIPSRAFCSDESQGYPIILIAKHFGTFPFNHGRVGGIVATDRHGPHAEHGKDAVIIQASHVGYDPETQTFGIYRRLQTKNNQTSTNCGKIEAVLSAYQNAYHFAQRNIFLQKVGNQHHVIIDNQLIDQQKSTGVILNLTQMIQHNESKPNACIQSWSTAKSYLATDTFIQKMGSKNWREQKAAIMEQLAPPLFSFANNIQSDEEGHKHLELNLMQQMPTIVCSISPMLSAACINTQIEFERSFRSIIREPAYKGKKVILISGLNIDISPQPGQLFPLTKFIPWAASIHKEDGSHTILEQDELWQALLGQDEENKDEIDLEEAIQVMKEMKEIKVEFSQ